MEFVVLSLVIWNACVYSILLHTLDVSRRSLAPTFVPFTASKQFIQRASLKRLIENIPFMWVKVTKDSLGFSCFKFYNMVKHPQIAISNLNAQWLTLIYAYDDRLNTTKVC